MEIDVFFKKQKKFPPILQRNIKKMQFQEGWLKPTYIIPNHIKVLLYGKHPMSRIDTWKAWRFMRYNCYPFNAQPSLKEILPMADPELLDKWDKELLEMDKKEMLEIMNRCDEIDFYCMASKKVIKMNIKRINMIRKINDAK